VNKEKRDRLYRMKAEDGVEETLRFIITHAKKYTPVAYEKARARVDKNFPCLKDIEI